jgi:hypothetical protein
MPEMMPPMGGKPADPLAGSMSMLNPTDLTMMSQEGKFSEDMTIADVLAQVGLKPEDPAQKLFEFGKNQVKNANPMQKAKNMANQGSMPPQGQGEEPSLDMLLK